MRQSVSFADMQQVVREAIKGAIDPLTTQVNRMGQQMDQVSQKVDDLNADRVRRDDIDGIRREMQQGFAGLETKFIPREMAERRFAELEEAIKTERNERMENQKAIASNGMNQWYKISMLAGGFLGFLSFLLNAISHISFHP